MEIPVVEEPERGKYEECNEKREKFRPHGGDSCGQFGRCLGHGQLGDDEAGNKKRHGERKDAVHECFKPGF
jgi:hypothetical protein